jgi:acyl-CoA synthetase (AMP-forming)/AMP-acid ligase II
VLPSSIADSLGTAASRRPDATALVVNADRTPISYGSLAGLVDDLARQLAGAGLRPGDRVGLRAPSGAEFVVGLFGASRAGLVAVPLDPALPRADQQARIQAAGARVVLVGDPDPAGTGDATLPSWPITVAAGDARVGLDTSVEPKPPASAPEDLRPDDALIMFTGGTTGTPKMVPWTHDNIANSVRNVIATYKLGPDDATVAVMPLFHGHGLIAALLSSLTSGGTVLIPAGGRFSAQTFADDVHAAGATWFTAVPTIHQILLQRGVAADHGRAPLRFIRSCSAPLSAETAQAVGAAFGAPMLSAYGMTEATHQVASTGANESVNSGLVGRSTGVKIRIAGEDGRPCPPEGVGEVLLRGETVVRGYLGNAAATASTFTDGWLHTGDLGSLSADGELTLRGRIKEQINRGGEKISPEHVENVLVSHPNVIEAAVFGVPDSLYGETVAAVIVPDSSATPTSDELAEFCRQRLAPFEVPANIVVIGELPHTAKGSVDRRAVAQRFGNGD